MVMMIALPVPTSTSTTTTITRRRCCPPLTTTNILLPPPHSASVSRTVAFTTPENYAYRLSALISLRQWTPLWCPTVVVEPTPSTKSNLLHHISRLEDFSAVAFTSRTGISAFLSALIDTHSPPLHPSGDTFVVSALGSDSELLTDDFIARICRNPGRVKVLIPHNATPSGLVESLGPGLGRRVLCPVPLVLGLEEPPVVPDFLRDLGLMGWDAARIDAYETRWVGPSCADKLVADESLCGGGAVVDAVVFTSTAEVEGLLKGLGEFGLGWEELRRRWPGLVVAAHGPVTALGAERLGLSVDVVSSRFSSFHGVVDALAHAWETSSSVV